MRRYLVLFVLAVCGALVLSLALRAPRAAAPVPVPEATPLVSMTVEVRDRDLIASRASIPVGTRVALAVTNAGRKPARVRLEGYEDRADTGPIAPGATVSIHFLADRPGDRFAWRVGDEPRGRLDVTGSHLVEGHR